jgi:DNA-binding response OmpR family regulator
MRIRLSKSWNSDAKIDLLITDVGLPGGMNGKQLAEAARSQRPRLKVLYITGYAENAAISNGHRDCGMHVLSKPFPLHKLALRIRSIIEDALTRLGTGHTSPVPRGRKFRFHSRRFWTFNRGKLPQL